MAEEIKFDLATIAGWAGYCQEKMPVVRVDLSEVELPDNFVAEFHRKRSLESGEPEFWGD